MWSGSGGGSVAGRVSVAVPAGAGVGELWGKLIAGIVGAASLALGPVSLVLGVEVLAVDGLDVFAEGGRVGVGLGAGLDVTDVGLAVGVGSVLVLGAIGGVGEGFAAVCVLADVGLVAGVAADVGLEVLEPAVALGAAVEGALVGLLAGMSAAVDVEHVLGLEGLLLSLAARPAADELPALLHAAPAPAPVALHVTLLDMLVEVVLRPEAVPQLTAALPEALGLHLDVALRLGILVFLFLHRLRRLHPLQRRQLTGGWRDEG